MRRRALLSAAAAGSSLLAGCSMFDESTTRPDEFDVTVTSEPPTAELTYALNLSDLAGGFDVPSREHHAVAVTEPRGVPDPASLTVGFAAAPSVASPATLMISLEVPGSASSGVELPEGVTPPLSTYHGTAPDGDKRLFLVPETAGVEQDEVVRRDRECWRPILPVGPEESRTVTGSETVRVEPGDSVTRAYFLVTPWAQERCLEPGQYRVDADAGWSFWVCSFDVEAPGDSRFTNRDVPALPGRRRVLWTHEAEAVLYTGPEREQVGLPNGTNRFVFHNHLLRSVAIERRSWSLFKLDDGSWFPIAPTTPTTEADSETLRPGESRAVELRLFTDPDRPPRGERDVLGGLGSGLYALNYPSQVTVPGSVLDSEEPPSPTALFEIVGNEPSLSPSDAIDHVTERDGTRHAYTTADESSNAVLALSRSTASPSARLIREQVLQRSALRNAVALLRNADDEGDAEIDAVHYHVAPERIVPVVPLLADGSVFAFEGATYEIGYR